MKVLLNKLKLNLVCSSHLIFGHVLISNIACIVSFFSWMMCSNCLWLWFWFSADWCCTWCAGSSDSGCRNWSVPPSPSPRPVWAENLRYGFLLWHSTYCCSGVDEKAVRFIRLKNLLIHVVILDVDIKIHIEWSLYIHWICICIVVDLYMGIL